MNKYSNKIITFLNKIEQGNECKIKNIDNNKFIKFLKASWESTNIPEWRETIKSDLGILNKSGKPFAYHSHEDIPFNEFVQQHRENKIKTSIPERINLLSDHKPLFSNLYSGRFVSLDIQYHAETSDLSYCKCESDDTVLHMYVPNNTESPNINHIFKLVAFMRKLSNHKSPLTIIIFAGTQKKYLTFPGSLSSDNMNSGMSYDDTIVIWRQEELYKVLIHELVHQCEMDYTTIEPAIESIFREHISVDGIDKVNESNTEIIALVLNLITQRDESITDLLNCELAFSLYQCAKITDFTKPIKQYSSAMSYYVVKTCILISFNSMCEYWTQNMSFTVGDDYINLYESFMNNLEVIQKYSNKFANQPDSFISKTMRMTVYA